MATSDDDYSPILDGTGGGIGLTAKLMPTRKKQFSMVLHIADGVMRLNNVRIDKAVETQLSDLETLADATTLTTLYTPNNPTTGYSVTFKPGGLTYRMDWDEKTRKPDWYVTASCSEV